MKVFLLFRGIRMVRMVWTRCINLVWTSLTRVRLSSLCSVFAHMENNELMTHFQIIFEFLRYWFNWNIGSAFAFDLQVGMRKSVVKLEGLLLWQ